MFCLEVLCVDLCSDVPIGTNHWVNYNASTSLLPTWKNSCGRSCWAPVIVGARLYSRCVPTNRTELLPRGFLYTRVCIETFLSGHSDISHLNSHENTRHVYCYGYSVHWSWQFVIITTAHQEEAEADQFLLCPSIRLRMETGWLFYGS